MKGLIHSTLQVSQLYERLIQPLPAESCPSFRVSQLYERLISALRGRDHICHSYRAATFPKGEGLFCFWKRSVPLCSGELALKAPEGY